MKTIARRFLMQVAAIAVLAGWPFAAQATASARGPEPELSIALPGLLDDALEQGEPLSVIVRIESSGESPGSVELAPAAGTWADAIAVELLSASGGTVLARAAAVGVPDSPHATIDRERIAGGMWLFPASATQSLAPGDYIVRARLELNAGRGWTGQVVSEDVPLNIVGVSSAPERASARMLARAQILFSQGAYEEAAQQLDAVLTKTPNDFELLCQRAEVALAGRNPIAAMVCLGRAARLRSPQASGPPPPIFAEVQSRVLAAQLAGVSPDGPPAWTWPPLAVLTLSEREAAELLEKTRSAAAAASPRAHDSAASAPATSAASPAPSTTRAADPAPRALPVSPEDVRVAGVAVPAAAVAAAPAIGVLVPAAELSDSAIRAESAGQWATSAVAGSQYGRTQYSAAQAAGAPNVPVAGNSPDAWCPANRDTGVDWLEVTFSNPVHATEVRVRQNDAAGAIVRVEAIEPDGTAHTWWEGVDPYQPPAVREIVWFAVRVPKTAYLVARVKLTLNLASGPGYKEIDAVQLVGAP